jgi:prevent-host-death family protein
VEVGDSNHKGNVAELKIAAAAAEIGIGVLAPLTEHGRYDLIFDTGDRLMRIQCKWAGRKGDVVVVRIRGSYHSPSRGYVLSTYNAAEVDAIAAYCADLDTSYLLPIDEVDGLGFVHLRLAPARNGQIAGVRMAAEFELGAVAQLGERGTGSAEGVGSSPISSTNPSDRTVVGAHEFRNRFGQFMERASRGETFHVTRRGKPYVRLGPGGREERGSGRPHRRRG